MPVLIDPASAPVTAGAIASPELGATTALEANGVPTADAFSFTDHYSFTGDLVLMCCTRSNGVTSPTVLSATWGGTAFTMVRMEKTDGVGRPIVYCGYVSTNLNGVQSLVVTYSSGQVRDFAGFVTDIRPTAAGLTIGDNAFLIENVSQSSQTITLPSVTSIASVLIGAVFALDGSSHPFDVSAGWTEASSAVSGVATDNIGGVLATRMAGSTGSISLTGTTTSLFATDDWASVALELTPS